MLQIFDKKDTGKPFSYLLTLPEGFDKEKESLPLIVFLHGAGERGDNPEMVAVNGIPKLFRETSPVRAITFSPQCQPNRIWNTQIYPLKAMIDEITETYRIDKNRITVTGLSMGGFGTWELGMSFPDAFAALAPVCGGGTSWRCDLLKMPIRAFHGTDDQTVPVRNSIEMVDAVNTTGGHAELTLYHRVGHDSWTKTYEETDLVDGLYRQSKNG